MGYCVDATIDVLIPGDGVPGAIQALLKLMNEVQDQGGGGVFKGGQTVSRNYSWVGTEQVVAALTTLDLVKALEEWRYDASAEESSDLEKLATPDRPPFGDVRVEWFSGEKWGDDEKLWTVLAPFVQKGGSIEWRGEDDERWRYVFTGEGMKEQRGMTVWG
jgi:hypothetical protein